MSDKATKMRCKATRDLEKLHGSHAHSLTQKKPPSKQAITKNNPIRKA